MNKSNFLNAKIVPFDPEKTKSNEDLLVNLQGCSFQGRKLGNALEILTSMVQTPNCLKVLTLSGAMIPAGMEETICQMIEKNVVNVIVSTGANIIHSVVNSCDNENHQSHYIGSEKVDDKELYNHRINRIYDTFITEDSYRKTEDYLKDLLLKNYEIGKSHVVLPSDLFAEIGNSLSGRSFLHIAAKHNVPIFCGATSDSELALDLLVYRKENNLNIILDEIADIDKFGEYIKKYSTRGTIIIGGGVPRNWAQQIFPFLDQIHSDEENEDYKGYDYSVRFHTALEYDGGLSGCTLNESISWGKYKTKAVHQSVWGDATVYLPILISALFQRLERLKKEKKQE